MADVLAEATAAVYGRLSGDATLMGLIPGGIWENRAPVDVESYPFLAFSLLLTRTDSTMTGPYRHVFDLRVTCLDKSEALDASAAVLDRVYALLQDVDDANMTMPSYAMFFCRRAGVSRLSPVRQGETFQQVIHAYRFEVRPS